MNRRDALKQTALIMGYAISGSTVAAVLNSCKSQPELDWKPVLFTEQQAALLTEMTERILPKTDTPGAKDLKLANFIDKMVHEVFSKEDQEGFKAWMNKFGEKSNEVLGKSFLEASAEQQEELLMQYEKNTPKIMPSIWGFPTNENGDEPETGKEPKSYYRTLKDLTILGYFTSQEVGKNILSYDPLPGTYEGCIPLSQIGNTWTE